MYYNIQPPTLDKLVKDDENSCEIWFTHTYRRNVIRYNIRIVDIPTDLNQSLWTFLSYTIEDDCVHIKDIRAYKWRKGYGRRMIEELKIISRELQLPIKAYSYSSIPTQTQESLDNFFISCGFEIDHRDSEDEFFIWKEKSMKIYLLSQDIVNDYDTYDSAIVIAENEDEARKIHPNRLVTHITNGQWMGTYSGGGEYENEPFDWVRCSDIDKLSVKYIGEADASQQKGLVLASFNAG